MVDAFANSAEQCNPLRHFHFSLASEASDSCYIIQEHQCSDDVAERHRVQLQARQKESQLGNTGKKLTFRQLLQWM